MPDLPPLGARDNTQMVGNRNREQTMNILGHLPLGFLDRRLRKYAKWRKWRGLPDPMPIAFAQIAKEALAILSQNATFLSSVNRDWPEEGKGDETTIKIRRPPRPSRRRGS